MVYYFSTIVISIVVDYLSLLNIKSWVEEMDLTYFMTVSMLILVCWLLIRAYWVFRAYYLS